MLKGKAGFSEEYLDKLQDGSSNSDHTLVAGGSLDNGDALSSDIRWDRLRLSDGDLLRTSTRDVEFQKLKVEVNQILNYSLFVFIVNNWFLVFTGFGWCRFWFRKWRHGPNYNSRKEYNNSSRWTSGAEKTQENSRFAADDETAAKIGNVPSPPASDVVISCGWWQQRQWHSPSKCFCQ